MYNNFLSFLREKPQAIACIKGGNDYPEINGKVYFYQKRCGVLVVTEVCNLPKGKGKCDNGIFAFHIHSGSECKGDDFPESGTHFNPAECLHPYHAGDMPPLFNCNGYAFSAFFTDRFNVKDVLDKVVIIHSGPDDFTTQPSGNPGEKIACGKIIKTLQR